jgi:hypothetical protein
MVGKVEARPPEIVEKIARALVPPACREHVLGDLNERYVSHGRYILDVLHALPFLIGSRLRRTSHPIGLLISGGYLWFAVFWGNKQESWLAATIPALVALLTLAMRDVYRGITPNWTRAVAIDIAVAAAGVLLSQAVLAAAAPELMLTRETLRVGFPIGFVILYFVRLQSPTGSHRSPAFARSMSMQELRAEIVTYESIIRRAVRIEIGACIVVALAFSAFVLVQHAPLIVRIGQGLTAAAAVFICWFLYRYGRVRPIPTGLGFTETVAAYRSDLERRRQLSVSYAWWYVAPLSIGLAVMFFGPELQRPNSLPTTALGIAIFAAIGSVLVLAQCGVARRTQQRIDQLAIVQEKADACAPHGARAPSGDGHD